MIKDKNILKSMLCPHCAKENITSYVRINDSEYPRLDLFYCLKCKETAPTLFLFKENPHRIVSDIKGQHLRRESIIERTFREGIGE